MHQPYQMGHHGQVDKWNQLLLFCFISQNIIIGNTLGFERRVSVRIRSKFIAATLLSKIVKNSAFRCPNSSPSTCISWCRSFPDLSSEGPELNPPKACTCSHKKDLKFIYSSQGTSYFPLNPTRLNLNAAMATFATSQPHVLKRNLFILVPTLLANFAVAGHELKTINSPTSLQQKTSRQQQGFLAWELQPKRLVGWSLWVVSG